jgi:hypothetical protein
MIGIIPNPAPRIGMSPVENTFGRAAVLMLPSEHQHYYDCVCAHDDRMRQDKHQDFETTAVLGNGVPEISRKFSMLPYCRSIAGGGGGDVMLECFMSFQKAESIVVGDRPVISGLSLAQIAPAPCSSGTPDP